MAQGKQIHHMGGKEERVIFVKNIDGVTTEKKIKKAINAFQGRSINAQVITIKPAFGGNQNAMVAISKEKADFLTRDH